MIMYHFIKTVTLFLKIIKEGKGIRNIKYFQYYFQYQNYEDLTVNKPHREL